MKFFERSAYLYRGTIDFVHKKLFDFSQYRHTGIQTDRQMNAQAYRYRVSYPSFSIHTRCARKYNELILA